jgi:hypothetical protein
MEYPKFKLNKDWNIESDFAGIKNKILIFSEGHTFEANEEGLYIIEWIGGKMSFTEDQMRLNKELFTPEEIRDDIEIHIEEVSEDDSILVRNWRIQLDVKTTRKKLKEVQQLIEKHIRPIL